MNPLSDKIDELITAELEAHPERLVAFFARVQSNYDEAIRTATRFFLSMLAAWLLTYAIYQGYIQKIEIFGFDFDRKMIVASPFVIGLLTYGLLSALAGAVVLWEAVSRGVHHMLPTAAKNSLDDLLAPPTFSNIERMLEPRLEDKLLSLFSRSWFVLITLLMFGGSFAALVHTTYLLFRPRPDTQLAVLGIGSAILGALAWFRGVVLFGCGIEATGGFHLGHHRRSGRLCVVGTPSPEPLSQDLSPRSKNTFRKTARTHRVIRSRGRP